MSRPIIALDLDGVLATYDGWHGPDTPIGTPAPGVHAFLNRLAAEGWDAVVFTGRPAAVAEAWCKAHGIRVPVHDSRNGKPMATVFLDDRALRFEGSFQRALVQLEAARKPWWSKGR